MADMLLILLLVAAGCLTAWRMGEPPRQFRREHRWADEDLT